MVKISIGKDLGIAKTREIEWSKLSKALTKHEQANRKGGKFFVGGYFRGKSRKEDTMVARSLLTLDCDDIPMGIDEFEGKLVWLLDFAFAAYSTYSHRADAPRVRVVIPMSRELSPDEYRVAARAFGEKFEAEFGVKLDECSYKPNQLMYMPTCPDLGESWSCEAEGRVLDIEPYLEGVGDSGGDSGGTT